VHKGIKVSFVDGILTLKDGPSLCRIRYRQKISNLADGVFLQIYV